MTSGLGGGARAAELPPLLEETELQKMLVEEKMRCEKHKTLYLKLKQEYTSLQNQWMKSQADLTQTLEECKVMRENFQKITEKKAEELNKARLEIEQLSSQVMTSQRLDVLKMQVVEEVESPYREKFKRLEQEADACRNECNKIKYEHTFLKSEYEHERQEASRILQETKLRYEAEIKSSVESASRLQRLHHDALATQNTHLKNQANDFQVGNLRKEREALAEKFSADQREEDGARLRGAQRDVAQLNIKVKGLLSELEDLRAQREHQGAQADSVARLQQKQLAENTATIKALETERQSLKMQVETLQKELNSSHDVHSEISTKLDDLEKEKQVLRNRVEEVTHTSKVEVANVKMDMLKERGELDRERDRLRNEIDDLRTQVELGKHSLAAQEAALVEKEHEAARRVHAAREEEWLKLHKLEADKLETETRLQELQRKQIDDETARQTEREKLEERMRVARDEKEAAEKEALVAKTKLTHQEALLTQVEAERAEAAELRSRLSRLQSQYEAQTGGEQELLALNTRYKQQLDTLTEELRRAKEHITRCRETSERTLTQQRLTWGEEKLHLQRRVDELEGELGALHDQVNTLTRQHKKKKKRYLKLCTALREKTQIQEARIEEMTLEKDLLRKQIPAGDVNLMKKQLKEIVRKNRQFRAVLLSGNMCQIPIGDYSFASVGAVQAPTFMADVTDLMGGMNIDTASQQLKDLEAVHQRCDALSDEQRVLEQQLQDMTPAAPPPPAVTSSPRASPPAPDLRMSDLEHRLSDSDKENVESSA